MSIDSPPTNDDISSQPVVPPRIAVPKRSGSILDWLRPLASLKLTVVLFLISIVLIQVGTLAQAEMNMWEVLDQYFRTWVAWVELDVFFPQSFFPSAPHIPGGFYMPGGWAIGLMLGLNLLAAHLLRFRVQAKGARLLWGTAATVIGLGVTGIVIATGHNKNGIQAQPVLPWPVLWQVVRWSSVVLWIGSLVLLLKTNSTRRLEWFSYLIGCIALGGLALYLVVCGGEPLLGDSSLRIVWQLLQGGVAGLALLIGAIMLFKQRGGIVVIHLGVALLMFGELLVSLTAVEEQMVIAEGATATFSRESNSVELAVVDPTPSEHDNVTIVPGSLLTSGKPIFDSALPFDIEVVKYFKNARLRKVVEGEENVATAGVGLQFVADKARGNSGASMSGVDVAAAYVRLTPKNDPSSAAVYLLSQQFGDASIFASVGQDLPERMLIDGSPLLVSLRQKRKYKPYEITLNDVRKNDYLGTNTPMDYSSYVTLSDPSRDVNGEQIRIWMNNPLRYAGETFYQQSYAATEGAGEVTTLAVVSNTGWMIPYVACMLALIGMLAHFLGTLKRFVGRRMRETEREVQPESLVLEGGWKHWIPVALAAVVVLMFVGRSAKPLPSVNEMDLEAFGKLPMVYQGRVKPIDTFARNMLKIVSNKQSFTDATAPKKSGKPSKQPAIKWFLDAASQLDNSAQHQVFYIPDFNMQSLLGLQPRKHYRYSLDEFRDNLTEFDEAYRPASATSKDDPSKLTAGQRKILEVGGRLYTYLRMVRAFRPLPFPDMPTAEQRKDDPEKAEAMVQQLASMAMEVPNFNAAMMADQPPLFVPVPNDEDLSRGDESVANSTDDHWQPYSVAMNSAFVETALQRGKPSRFLLEWNRILDAYRNGNGAEFNRAVASYQGLIERDGPNSVDANKLSFESMFNRLQPFSLCAALYFLAFLINAGGWLGWFQPLRRTALWLIAFTFVLHTVALVGRIYISGRPPVTNLYSSAVFIGWGVVALCMILENVFKLSIANAIAAIGGVATLIVAHNLAGDGDTMIVLQAVLDTQFWLATHVVTVTLGYTTTFVAGGLATAYLLGAVFSKRFDSPLRSALIRMIYGTLCFAIFFSFVGTVLGGLWADDSWGRFWGWDPKENGALVIVLWNALILHARWGGMVRERGLAALAVLGNVATAWSWFGVNELGVGLHSYGFTEGALRNLGLYCLAQCFLAALALIPMRLWRSAEVTVE